MNSAEIRKRFIAFFEKRGHVNLPSASLVAAEESDSLDKTLFTTAGMQPLIPYLLGKEHPSGKRLVNIQKCVRTGDIDDVGDNRHLTFFEMMGNWSLGDYFKKDAISWSYEFLTSKEEGLGLNPQRLYVTIFEGDENAPLDIESKEIWMNQGVPEHRTYPLGAEDNWWSPGENGPCGPDTEMFYDLTEVGLGDLSKEDFIKAVQKEDLVEIWNDVFMEYEKKNGKVIGKLEKKNVDTGAGLERITAVMQGKKTAYDTDIFESTLNLIKENSQNFNVKNARIVADHLRTSCFLIADGVLPSNKDRGYVLRRLMRRSIFKMKQLMLDKLDGIKIIESLVHKYDGLYELDKIKIQTVFREEEIKFLKTLNEGMQEFEHITKTYINGALTDKILSPHAVFTLYTSYGFPVELIVELAKTKGLDVDMRAFEISMREHEDLSRTGAEQKFKGGLAGHSDIEVKYHTATHLLHQALYDVLGSEVGQKGSNITPERLRFDFSFPRKMTDEEKQEVEDIVNEKIREALPVQKVVMPKADAEKTGARHFFGEKYPDEVSVYFIGNSLETAYSKEFCGGPHISNTNELGHFKIQKEEAVSAGIRRIKAILE